ncbi:helix-turn-helix transcriptional regulator [Sphaerisporangium sp. NPDC051017]|uniref:helix-turn-helix transcriptional regulator n=1 Tax=Sphaerisporangium sp. NPDC051017 TaxID=3154636 RepID=UPI00343DB28C
MTKQRRYASRPGLVRARRRLGLSQEEAAAAIGVTPRTWGRWERGDQGMRPVYRSRLAALFNVDPAEVERWVEGEALTPATKLSPMTDFGRGSPAATVRTAEHLWRCDMDLSRRHILAALPFAPAAFGEWLSAWTYDTRVVSAAHAGPGQAVGLADVTRIEEARQALTQMDHRYGSGLVRPAVVDYLNTKVAPLLGGRYDDHTGARLMTAAAGMTAFAGWTAFDLGRQGQAQYYYGQALHLARAANDSLTAAWVFSTMAFQAIHLEQPRWAIRLSRASVDAARRAQASPRVMARLYSREAWATALQVKLAETPDGQSIKRVHHLLSEVEQQYARGTTHRDPSWVEWFEATEPVAEAGIAWNLIGEHQRGAACAEAVLKEYTERRNRSAQLSRVSAAEAYLGMGELEQALDSAGKSLSMAKTLTSSRSLERLYRFDKHLTPYANTIHVREFRAHLTQTLTA